MSAQENINIVKQTYENFLRGDIESLLKLYAEDVQWDVYGPTSLPTAGTWRGRTGVAQFFAKVNEVLEAQSFEPQEFIAQDDQVVVLGHYTWTAKPTGRTFSAKWAHVVTLSNDKITRFREYTDTAAGAAAFAGSSGQSQPAGR